ncbi:MAG: YheU family protein [Myxococcota bacterium]
MDDDRSAPEPSAPAAQSGVELNPDQLSPGALRGLVEEYVTREGTDYGHSDWSLEDKVAQVFQQLECGEARIVFDLEQESASIVPEPELALHALESAPRAANG